MRTRGIYAAGLHQTQHMHARIGGATENELARFWKRPGGGHMTRHARTQDRRAGHGWPLMLVHACTRVAPVPTAWRGEITSTWRGCRPARGLKGSLDLQCTHSTDLSHSHLHPIRRSISIFSVVITPANQFQVRPPRADHSPRTVTREASSMPSLMSLTPWRRKKRAAGVAVRTRRRGTSLGALWRRLVRTLTCTRRPHY